MSKVWLLWNVSCALPAGDVPCGSGDRRSFGSLSWWVRGRQCGLCCSVCWSPPGSGTGGWTLWEAEAGVKGGLSHAYGVQSRCRTIYISRLQVWELIKKKFYLFFDTPSVYFPYCFMHSIVFFYLDYYYFLILLLWSLFSFSLIWNSIPVLMLIQYPLFCLL